MCTAARVDRCSAHVQSVDARPVLIAIHARDCKNNGVTLNATAQGTHAQSHSRFRSPTDRDGCTEPHTRSAAPTEPLTRTSNTPREKPCPPTNLATSTHRPTPTNSAPNRPDPDSLPPGEPTSTLPTANAHHQPGPDTLRRPTHPTDGTHCPATTRQPSSPTSYAQGAPAHPTGARNITPTARAATHHTPQPTAGLSRYRVFG